MSEAATTNGHALFDPSEVRRALTWLMPDGQVTELRALEATSNGDRWPGTYTGYFSDREKLIEALGTIKTAVGIYVTPNPVDPALIARANNRIRKAGKGESTSDRDIVRRRFLLIDCDAKRPAGVSATNSEHKAAIRKAEEIADELHFNHGWQEPIFGDSGNGGHLEYLIDEPADDGGLVEKGLAALAAKFSDDVVKVDTTVHNAARIWKLKGTRACKGDSTEDRPHRLSKIIKAPETLYPVSREQLEALAAEAPQPERKPNNTQPRVGSGDAFDIDGFIVRNGFELSGGDEYQGGRRWTFDRSPMCDHHDDGPYLIQFASGALSAGCHHESCSWSWHDLRARFEPKQERRGMPDLRPEEYRDVPRQLIQGYMAAELRERFPQLNAVVVDGWAREGETMNIIAPPKFGKSWLLDYILLCIVSGRAIFGKFSVSAGKALLVDNELHEPTIIHRLDLVAEAMGLLRSQWESGLEIWPVRGRLPSLINLAEEICDRFKPGEVHAIGYDAMYRFLPPGVSENDNASMKEIYNTLDRIGRHTQALNIVIHHASKGDQSSKSIVDVGAGAGSQSRAADTHLILRQHEEDGVAVLESAIRSFKPIEPLPLRWEWPMWLPEFGVDPAKLKGRLSQKQQQQTDDDQRDTGKLLTALVEGEATSTVLGRATGISRERRQRLLDRLAANGDIEVSETVKRGNPCYVYKLK